MELVTRAQWGAKAPKGSVNALSPTPKGVAVHYEGPHMGEFGHDQCAAKVRGIQAFHQNTRGWADIAYNFLVCPHGSVFEGRGLRKGSAAQGTSAGNRDYYAVCGLWGQGDAFTDSGRQGFADVIGYLRSNGAGNEVRPHSSFHATSCPGDPLRQWINEGANGTGAPVAPAPPSTPPAPAPRPSGLAVDGDFGPATVRRLQESLNNTGASPRLSVDGGYGPATKRALQGRLNHISHFSGWGDLVIDGVIGPRTIRTLQRVVGATQDGVWGPGTTRKLQEALNRGDL